MADEKKPRKPRAKKTEGEPAAKPAAKRAPKKKKGAVAAPVVAAVAATSAPAREIPRQEMQRLVSGEHAGPHSVLGAHPTVQNGQSGVVVRALTPSAVHGEVLLPDGRVVELTRIAEGLSDLYEAFIPDASLPFDYRYRFHFADGAIWERRDPYRFLPTIGDIDLHLFGEGTH